MVKKYKKLLNVKVIVPRYYTDYEGVRQETSYNGRARIIDIKK